MMTVFGFALWAIAGLVLDFALFAFLLRLRKGCFRIERDDRLAFAASTDFGRLTIDRTRAVVRRHGKQGSREIPFADVRRLDLGLMSCWPAAEEFFLTNFDVWDVFERYRDRINWLQVSIVATGCNPIPVFVVGQDEPREPFLERWFEVQTSVLTRLGLLASADDRVEEVLARLRRAFRKSGLEINMVMAEPTATTV